MKEDVGTVPVWVKLHGVPVTTFNKDGLSVIATKLHTPLMLYSYTSDMCMQSWGSLSHARAMIELQWKECPKNIATGKTKNLKKTRQTPKGIPVGQKMGFKPTKQVFQPVSKKPTANASINKKKNVEPAKEVMDLSTTLIVEKIDKIEKLIIEGKVTLVDDEGKPLEKVASSCEYDSEDEVASVDNDMANFLAKKDGYGTQSLLEQWTESYENVDYRYDPYDDDIYEDQDIPDKIQAIYDNLDIIVRVHRKKEKIRIKESLNDTFDESLPEPNSSSLVEDDRINEPIVQDLNGSSSLQVNVLDEGYPKSLKEARGHPIEQVISELNERTLRSKSKPD
ncbi:hypothetical protein Tco_0742757 [Tanacetum coccineum]